MNAFAIPPLLAGALNLGLICWIFNQTTSGMVRRTFILWNLGMCFWNFSIAAGYVITDRQEALEWYHWTIPFSISFIAPFFLQFVVSLTKTRGRQIKIILWSAYVWASLLSILGTTTPLLMRDVTPRFWGYYPLAGKGEWLFGISYVTVVLYALRLLSQARSTAPKHKRNQLKYLYTGALVCFGGGVTNILPLYGISIYPFGNLMNSIYSLVVAYAIVEYGLMDVQLVLRRGTVYALLSGSMTAVYLSLVAVLQRIFGHYGVEEHIALYTAAFPVTVVLAPAMKARIEPFVDQAFFHHPSENLRSDLTKKEMALFSVWASEMAHELTKPLTHIMNAGSQLGNTVKGSSRKNVKTIEKEVQRASEILDGFVMLSPERTLHRIAVSLTELLEEAVHTLGLSDDAQISIVRHYDHMPRISVNPGQIVQVLTNVIQNAWQAMPDGGRLSLSLKGVHLDKELAAVEISVSDTGYGIAPAIQEKVFHPFFTTKIAADGRGMGLTISRAMVERHEGTIAIESPITPQGGTRVTVRLPVSHKEASNER